jgi:hypothetical protein
MFGDKTKKSINNLVNIPDECNSFLSFRYAVYKDVYTKYNICLSKHTNMPHYEIMVEVIKPDTNERKTLENIECDDLNKALSVFFKQCQIYIDVVKKDIDVFSIMKSISLQNKKE